jgi:predicted DNA-binding protein
MTLKRNQTTLRLTSDLDEKLIKKSNDLGVSKNAYILMILAKDVQKAV